MTLLSAVTNVANEVGYKVDSVVSTSNDITTKQLLAMAQRIIVEMARAYPWTKLYASGSITLSSGVASYALPSAFSYYHFESFWNSSTRWRILGPMTEQEYALIRGYGLNTTVYQRFQVRGVTDKQLLISPTPGTMNDAQTIIFEYISNRNVQPQTWLVGTTFAANAYCFYLGNYYQTASGGSGGSAPTHTSGTTGIWTYYDGAYENFLADTDVPVFSQRVLEQGMLERFAEVHGLTAVQPRYTDQLAEEFSKDSVGKILYAGGENSPFMYARSGTAVFGTFI